MDRIIHGVKIVLSLKLSVVTKIPAHVLEMLAVRLSVVTHKALHVDIRNTQIGSTEGSRSELDVLSYTLPGYEISTHATRPTLLLLNQWCNVEWCYSIEPLAKKLVFSAQFSYLTTFGSSYPNRSGD